MTESPQAGRSTWTGIHRRWSVSQRWLNELLVSQLATYFPQGSERGTKVIDLGGGTGSTAVALAEAGHTVRVVDPSPDALASTQRRAAETGLADRISTQQGDTATLTDVVTPGSVDVVVCHLVLEQRAGTPEALQAIASVLVPGGLLSITIAQRLPKILQQAMLGNLAAARELLEDPEVLDRPTLRQMLADAGLRVVAEHGIGVVADHVPEAAAEGRTDELLELEAAVSALPGTLESATRLHILATRE